MLKIFYFIFYFLISFILFLILLKYNPLNFDILFYGGSLYSLLISFVTILFVIKSKKLSFYISLSLLAFVINYSFFILIPVSLDRSVSVFMLSTINKANEHGVIVDKSYLENAICEIYINKYDGVGRRLNEQQTSGNVLIEDKIKLTENGDRFLVFSRFVVDFLDLNKGYVDPELYSKYK